MTLSAGDLLATWELGHARHPLDRALLLFALAAPGVAADALADEPLGRRNAVLLDLRRALFGERLRAYLDCPECGRRLEFELDVAQLLDAGPPHATVVEVEGQRFRLPTTRDLARIAGETDAGVAAHRLLQACHQPGEGAGDEVSLGELLGPVDDALELADPCAEIRMDLHCELCGHDWAAPFDVPGFLWEDLESQAARWLDEVHLLAGAYGWAEADILALSEARRGAYLERVLA